MLPFLPPLSHTYTVAKRLSSKQALQPHAGATISFTPHAAQHPQPSASTSASTTGNDSPSTGGQDLGKATKQKQQQQQLEFQTDLLMLVAGNSRQMGRTLAVCPDALLDDGLLDFTLLSGSSLATQVGEAPAVLYTHSFWSYRSQGGGAGGGGCSSVCWQSAPGLAAGKFGSSAAGLWQQGRLNACLPRPWSRPKSYRSLLQDMRSILLALAKNQLCTSLISLSLLKPSP